MVVYCGSYVMLYIFSVHSGIWAFDFSIPTDYPFNPPKVILKDRIYHPNIDLEGKICVSALRPWNPTYSIQMILFGLIFLFSNPNPEDPLNTEVRLFLYFLFLLYHNSKI
jgi:ubiquitin-protein ligase